MTHPRFHAEQAPDRPAAVEAETGKILTYGALEARANRGAHLLRKLGIANGETVAIWLPTSVEYYEIYWAAQRAGVYIAPISTMLNASEVAYIIQDSGSKLLVTSGAVAHACELLQSDLSADLAVYTIGQSIDGVEDWTEATAALPDTPIEDESAGFHMVYSSGTTGRPKGVKLPLTGGPATASHMLAERFERNYGMNAQSVFLSPAPLYHTAPLAYSTGAQRLGATVIIMSKFDAEGALAAIERYRVTLTQMVPTMFVRMLRLPDEVRAKYRLSSLDKIIHSAAPCPIDVKHAMIDWLGPIIYEYYGGSESNGSTFITPQEWLQKPGSVGRANWGTIHICDDEGNELSAGEPGIVYFEGGHAFEYLNDPDKTRDSRHPKHSDWSALGDIGYLDADGYLFLTDRKSFMIVSGGVNVYPQEIENLLASHPKVADVAVFGVPNAEMGEEVKAIIQPIDWADATPETAADLIAYCREHLSKVKCPKSIDFDPALPRHDTGKLFKRVIRDRYWAGHGKRVA